MTGKIKMRIPVLVAAFALSILSAPPHALATTPAAQTPPSSASQQAQRPASRGKAASLTPAQRQAAPAQMAAKIKAATSLNTAHRQAAAPGQMAPNIRAAPSLNTAQRKAAHDQMRAKIKADSAARAAAGKDKVLTWDQRRALFEQKMQKLHPHTQNSQAPATP
jgi:hypothetical protein